MTAMFDTEPWMDDAICSSTDPEAFFVEAGKSTKPAKQICERCPVIEECLEYALRKDQRFGVWGGKSERERAQIRKGIKVITPDPDPQPRPDPDVHGVTRYRARGCRCQVCKDAFNAYMRKYQHHAPTYLIRCDVCALEFTGCGKTKFCSDECRAEARRMRQRRYYQARTA